MIYIHPPSLFLPCVRYSYAKNSSTEEPIEMLILHLNLYQDDFSTSKRIHSGSQTKSLCSYQLQCSEFSQSSRSNSKSQATMIFLICLASCIHVNEEATRYEVVLQNDAVAGPTLCIRGNEHLLKLFQEDMDIFAKGMYQFLSFS